MKYQKVTNPQIKKHFAAVYATPYCRIEGRNPDDFSFYRDLILEKTGYELDPSVAYYNCGICGWNWTGFAAGAVLFITGYYGNCPCWAKTFQDAFDLKAEGRSLIGGDNE